MLTSLLFLATTHSPLPQEAENSKNTEEIESSVKNTSKIRNLEGVGYADLKAGSGALEIQLAAEIFEESWFAGFHYSLFSTPFNDSLENSFSLGNLHFGGNYKNLLRGKLVFGHGECTGHQGSDSLFYSNIECTVNKVGAGLSIGQHSRKEVLTLTAEFSANALFYESTIKIEDYGTRDDTEEYKNIGMMNTLNSTLTGGVVILDKVDLSFSAQYTILKDYKDKKSENGLVYFDPKKTEANYWTYGGGVALVF